VGDRPLVVSYTTSPAADVLFATDGRTKPASVNVNLPGGVFRQVEYVGVIKGGKEPELARQWVDFMLDNSVQNDLPLQMFVYPANEDAETPALFDEFAAKPEVYSELAPEEIEASRERWIGEWTELMGG
jgi:thiamine transport system substrate-binding protein